MGYFGHSLHSEFAGQTLDWFGNDSFEKHCYYKKTRLSELEQFGLVDQEFTYTFNTHGFRSEEFNTEDSIVFLGASDTLGTGMPLEDTWTYLVAKELGLRRYNLGQGGGSGCTSFRLASYWLEHLNPKVVVYMSPLNPRCELAKDDSGETIYHQLSPAISAGLSPFWKKFQDEELKKDLIQYYNQWISSDDNLILLQHKNNLAIDKLSGNMNAKFILADSDKDWGIATCDLARDLMHGGVETNKNIAKMVLERIS